MYFLSKLKDVLGKSSIGLYRDDRLAAVASISGRRLDQFRKQIVQLFKEEGLSITIDINLIRTDFLDAMLDLESNTYSPFCKANNKPLYINSKSNHPPSIIKELPQMIKGQKGSTKLH